MTYPFASLPENLAAFCATLRRDHHFRIGPRELMDAAHALEIAEVANERSVRNALRPILSKTYDDITHFDTAFDRFFKRSQDWLPSLAASDALEPKASAERDRAASKPPPASRAPHDTRGDADVDEETAVGSGEIRAIEERETDAAATLLRASYSPLESEGAPLVLEPPDRAWLGAAALLAASVHAGMSRRWRPALRGPRFDFRRTLRTSLHTGGEPLTPRWRAHPRSRSRFVLLIDGSRSMERSAGPALRTAVALSAVSSRTETFAFSTTLRRITRDARRAAAGEIRKLHVQHAWGGGTTIGKCLDEYLLHYGDRLLGAGTVVIIVSDGLDVGDPDLLRHSMARLARRSAAVVWINPLLDTRGYEPIARGMSLARPHLAVLTSVRDPAGLRTLARAIASVTS